ncbi:MAG: metallopeptidase TldD-related protein [Patulibacter sp.]
MPLDLAALARRAAEFGGEEAIASVSHRRELVVECGPDGALRPPRLRDEVWLRLLIRDAGGRLGMVQRGGPFDDASLAVAAEQARHQASGGHLDLRPFAMPQPGPEHVGFDEATARLDPVSATATARATAASIEFALGRGRSASWRGESVAFAVARSGGGQATDARTAAKLIARATDDDGLLTGYAESAATDASLLDASEVGLRASPPLAPVLLRAAPQLFRGDACAVLLEPAALAPLLRALAGAACTGLSHATGTSPYTGRVGLPVAPATVTLLDAPSDPGTLPRSIDVEGTPASAVALIDAGRAGGVLHDTASAAEFGAASTGHAAALGGAPLAAAARNLVLLPAGERRIGLELAAECDGPVVRVSRIDQVQTAGPVATRFRAIGRAASLVEGGATVALLGDVVLAGDVAAVLADVLAVGGDSQLIARLNRLPERTTATACPPLLTCGLELVA